MAINTGIIDIERQLSSNIIPANNSQSIYRLNRLASFAVPLLLFSVQVEGQEEPFLEACQKTMKPKKLVAYHF